MKKYLMFMFCLVFAVSLVSFSGCKKKDNVRRQGQFDSSNSDSDGNNSAESTNLATNLPNSGAPDSTDTRLVLIPGQKYTLICEIDDTQNEGEFTIEGQASEKLSVKLTSVTGSFGIGVDDALRANSKKLDVRIEGDDQSNNIFVSCCKQANGFYFIMWHIENTNFVTLNDFKANKHLMRIKKLALEDIEERFVATLRANKKVKIGSVSVVREYYLIVNG
ncbi:MAG: hypothetical protein LBD17_02210 [Endomicrobium sp.]|jgi:hypothetical protein|nr:hypothetical protein [Endomicrobium sp.]